ncbi:hypothetical protein ACVWYH_006906 [Bradyrhizobium sp. GM24.11]
MISAGFVRVRIGVKLRSREVAVYAAGLPSI